MDSARPGRLNALAVLAFCAEITRLPGHWSPRLLPLNATAHTMPSRFTSGRPHLQPEPAVGHCLRRGECSAQRRSETAGRGRRFLGHYRDRCRVHDAADGQAGGHDHDQERTALAFSCRSPFETVGLGDARVENDGGPGFEHASTARNTPTWRARRRRHPAVRSSRALARRLPAVRPVAARRLRRQRRVHR